MQGSTSGFLTDALNLFEQQLPADVDKLFRSTEGILDVVKFFFLNFGSYNTSSQANYWCQYL